MAAKKAVGSEEKKVDLVEAFAEFSQFKNVDRATLMGVLEDVFRTMIRKQYNSDENFEIIVNIDKGDIQGIRERTVVEDTDIEDENRQIPLSEALILDGSYEIGDEVAESLNFMDFGRKIVQTAKQTLTQKIKDLEKSVIIKMYEELKGEIIFGEVYQVWRNEILVSHEHNELSLPKEEQIPKDHYRKNDSIRAVIKEIRVVNSNPKIIISRTDPSFLAKLFEQEVPEIYDGIIVVRGIAREPGERAKVAVESYDDRIDPVGACVGMKGARIHGIVRELRNENIDVINYTANPTVYIKRALSPAEVQEVRINESEKTAQVYVKQDQVALAIGKGGTNIKLASLLTGYQIDVFRETEYMEDDVELEEFSDEIEDWVIEALKQVGCDTAKDVLKLSVSELERRTDLDRETIEEIQAILSSEFEEQ